MVNKNILMSLVNRHKNIDPKIYHNALQLLKIYSDVVWINVEEYSDVVCECSEISFIWCIIMGIHYTKDTENIT